MPLAFEYLDPDAIMATGEFAAAESFLRASRRPVGWHYVIDLAWIFRQVSGLPVGSRILDAGGGHGPTQFLLAELGFDIVNVDLLLPLPPAVERARYGTTREVLPSHVATAYVDHLQGEHTRSRAGAWLARLRDSPPYAALKGLWIGRRLQRWRAGIPAIAGRRLGSIDWKVGNLRRVPELPAAHFDAVVSLSSLEHVPADDLAAVLQELRRVLKPGGRWAITTSASASGTSWFHQPSRGWCFSAGDLGRHFGAAYAGAATAAEVLERYRRCAHLRDNLAGFYRESGNNGMPWGVWDPQYVPVGIRLGA